MASPEEITDLHGEGVVHIASSGDVSAAITEEGELYTWGKTQGGEMQSSDSSKQYGAFTSNQMQPTYLNANGLTFKQVSCGRFHLAALTKNGKVITWGDSDNGKLGHT